MFRPIRFAVFVAGVTLAFTAVALPAPNDGSYQGQGQYADPPTRVARLAFIRGDVSFVPAGENNWVQAQLNRPLITGDKLWTDRNSRTELEIGSSTIRMDQNTSFDFLNLDDKVAQVELTQGTLNLRVRRLYDGQSYEIDTPTLAFVVNRVGEYRVTVEPDGRATTVSVFHGGGDTYGEGNARFQLEEGQSVTFNDAQLQNYQSNNLPQSDDFQTFSSQRDQRWDHARSRQYVSEDVIGYQDLDDNGDWNDVPEYGHVWYPTTVSAGWSPYHNGRWGWVGAYGWSWIDDEPWGFAPSHYGRWAYIDNRWGWCPGPIDARPYYAPALVAFIGGGVGVSIGFDSGPIGWFPLGYNDVYYPSYRVSQGYFSGINISNTHVSNTTVINNYYGNYSSGNVNYGQINYANRNVAGAITAVPAATFVGARAVAGAAIAVNPQTFANSRVSGFAAVAPTPASLTAAGAARALPPAALANRQIVAATTPPAPVAPFAQRQALLQKSPGQPLLDTQLRAPLAANVAARGAVAAPGPVVARPNLRVVTNGGVPASTAAPVLPARAAALNAPNARVAPVGAPGAATLATPATPAMPPNRANMPLRGNAADARTPPAATGVRPAPNAPLDSSRFAHPNATPQNNAGEPPRAVTGRPSQPSMQNARSPNAVDQRGPAARNEPGSRPTPVSRPAPTSNGDLRSNGNVVTPANRNPPENRMPSANYNPRATAPQQEYRTQQANPRTNPAPSQDYQRAAPQRETPHAAPQQYQQHQAPQPQQRTAPASQMQQERVAPQPQFQQQRAAPAPQMQQERAAPQPQFQQQRAAPPPPMGTPAPVRNAPPPKDKKADDDPRHGGRG